MKKLLFPAMFLAATIVGCADDESTAVGGASTIDNGDLVSINVYAGTTKGDDTTTNSIELDEYVLLHIDDSDGVAESYKFVYSSSDWSQSGSSITWSDIKFPANFYSLHDDAALDGVTFYDDDENLSDGYAKYENYKVTGNSSTHKDLVYHASRLSAAPSGGTLSAYHKHALSKIHLYASTGYNLLYVARVQMVNIDGKGTVTITPLDATDITTSNGVEWDVTEDNQTYQYFFISGDTPTKFTGSNQLINTEKDAPLMIIPQQTTKATVVGSDDSLVATISEGSYIEVIYYLTNSAGVPIVGYSSVSEMPNGSYYKDENQVLYVAAAFPLGYTFTDNTEYDITLGIGSKGSTGGKLIYDYYVDKNGDPVYLTKVDGDEEEVEVPEIDEGDDILSDGDDEIDIVVSACDWTTGSSVDLTGSEL